MGLGKFLCFQRTCILIIVAKLGESRLKMTNYVLKKKNAKEV